MPGATASIMPADRKAGRPGSCTLSTGPRLMGPGSGELRTGSSHALLEAINTAKHLLSGALSAVTTRTCCAPLERVKMDMILHRRSGSGFHVAWDIVRHEGPLGFWRGNGINILRTAPYKAVNFFSYDAYRKAFEKALGHDVGNCAKLCAGALAGITATLLCFPLDVLRTRVMLAPKASPAASAHPLVTLATVARQEGLPALWVGVVPALIAMAPSGAIFFGLFDVLKSVHLGAETQRTGRRVAHLDPLHSLLFGALAGAAAESSVYPFEVIRRRMQTMAAAAAVSTSGSGGAVTAARVASLVAFRQAAADIWARDRLRGFYSGIVPNTVQVLPSAALSYWAYETFKGLLEVAE